ncbi:hypothetical protein F2Q69_00047551 [Brassica cretica]|uniref:Uncharacterized protein n=1 Tax=Brassica cretica TaxID=69181 RepID=A0A8S9PP50_BRACR|nr:hypothetical protein F2Q69_00047551 [Brassica cretica]
MQEGDFKVESSTSFGGSHWCRSTPYFEHRSTDFNPNRSIGSLEHRSMIPSESTASCKAVRILTHEEFAARHPHLPVLFTSKSIDIQILPSIDSKKPPSIDNLQRSSINKHLLRNPKFSVDRHLPSDIDRYFSPDIDQYLAARHGCDFDSCT